MRRSTPFLPSRGGAWFGLFLGLLANGRPASGSPEALQELLAKEPPPSGVAASICFAPLCGTQGRVVFDADRPLPPASVQKIVTSAAALDLLGPDYRFTTSVWADAEPREGTIEGNLYLVGDGDPFLVTERLWLLAREVANRGVRRVVGALVVVTHADSELAVLRAAERSRDPYAAPVSRLAVNFNSLAFLVLPAQRPGGPATVWVDPFPIPGLRFDSAVRTVPEGGTTAVEATRRDGGEPEVWDIQGEIAVGSEPLRIYQAASDPAMLAGGTFAGLLGQNGVTVASVTRGQRPPAAVLLAVLPSLSLGSLVRNMNLWSNNFMADLLLLCLGDSLDAPSGRARITRWLAECPRLDPVPIVADGSGLSPQNRISAAQVVSLLAWAHARERTGPDLFASFPRPGGEGTLEKRFRGLEAVAVRAKTGTLGDSGVSSIAGTVDHPTLGRFVFCILQQAPPDPGKAVPAMRAREERWIRTFAAP